MTDVAFELRCGSRGEPCRDLPDREPLIIYLDSECDPIDELDVLVARFCVWLSPHALEFRALFEYDEFETGATLRIFECDDEGGDLFASLTRLDNVPVHDDRQFEIVW